MYLWVMIAIFSCVVVLNSVLKLTRHWRHCRCRHVCMACGYDVRVQIAQGTGPCPECGAKLCTATLFAWRLLRVIAGILLGTSAIAFSLAQLFRSAPTLVTSATPGPPTSTPHRSFGFAGTFDYAQHALWARACWQRGLLVPEKTTLGPLRLFKDHLPPLTIDTVDAMEADLLARAKRGDQIDADVLRLILPCVVQCSLGTGPLESSAAFLRVELLPPITHTVDLRLAVDAVHFDGAEMQIQSDGAITLQGIRSLQQNLGAGTSPSDIRAFAGRRLIHELIISDPVHRLALSQDPQIEVVCTVTLMENGNEIASTTIDNLTYSIANSK